jgi:MFS family permease
VTIGVAGISNIAYSGPMEVALPFLIKDRLQADVGVLGLFYSISALGSILAAVWLGRLPRLRRRGLTLYLAWMMVGVMVAAIGLLRWVPAVLAASFIIGASNTVLGLVWENTLQEYVPRRLFGRVSSVDYLGSYILLPLGYAYGGWAAEHIGVSLLFLTGGTLQTVLIALGLLHPKIRRLD